MTAEFRYGLITGAGICLWITAEYYLGLHTAHPEVGEYTGYFSVLVPVLTLFLLLRQKQAASRHGSLSLGQGAGAGLTTSFLAALIVYGFMIAYNQWINPDWIDNALTVKVATMRAHRVDEAEIRRMITSFRWANGARGMLVSTMLGLTVVGGIISVILTLLLRFQSRSRKE